MKRYDCIFKRILSPMCHIITVTDNGQCMRLKFCGIVEYKVLNISGATKLTAKINTMLGR